MLVSLLCLGSGALVAAPSAQALSAPARVKASGGQAFDAILVSWKWSNKPASYLIQIGEKKSFAGARKVKVAARYSRPAGGRQSYRFKGLEDGTRFFVRVAAVTRSGKQSGWTRVQKVATRTRFPSAPSGPVTAASGPGPGEVTFTWETQGLYTDYFKIETATSPFANGMRDHRVFKVDPDLRTYTLSAEQTASANAGVGTAWTLVWRFRAVNEGTAGSEQRYFGQGQSRVPGMAPTGTGSPIRVASYNIRTDKGESGELGWINRVPHIVQQIEDRKPGIVLLQELYSPMVPRFVATLADHDMNHYALNRETALKSGLADEKKLQNRLLYDATKYEMVDECDTSTTSTDCHIIWPSDTGPDYSPYVRMRDLATGQEFYVLSLHLPNGAALDGVRHKAMDAIVEELAKVNTDSLPVILGGDTNSSQLRTGVRPHDVLMESGFYDTASTVDHVNPEFGTANDFEYQEPSAFGISPRIDLIATHGMPGSARFVNEVIKQGKPFPSDHNMIWADLRLP